MCGLAGYSLKRPSKRANCALRILATHADKRGGHSWGAAIDGEVSRGLGSLSRGMEFSALRGAITVQLHARYATTGAITTENAHPLEVEGIIGCHNGQVRNHADLNRWYQRDYDVDSCHIFAHLAAGEPLEDLDGWGAITMQYEGDSRVYLGGEPLHIARGSWGAIWCSTEAVYSACDAVGLRFREDWIGSELVAFDRGRRRDTYWHFDLGASPYDRFDY